VLPLEEALAEQGGVHCEAHRRLLDTLNFANVSNLCSLKGARPCLSPWKEPRTSVAVAPCCCVAFARERTAAAADLRICGAGHG